MEIYDAVLGVVVSLFGSIDGKMLCRFQTVKQDLIFISILKSVNCVRNIRIVNYLRNIKLGLNKYISNF